MNANCDGCAWSDLNLSLQVGKSFRAALEWPLKNFLFWQEKGGGGGGGGRGEKEAVDQNTLMFCSKFS